MSKFSTPLYELARRRKQNLDDATKRATFGVFSATVERSPVGQPALWKDPTNAPAGYVGGRFRANWNFSVGAPDESITESTDKGRGAREAARALSTSAGSVVYFTNGLPYAKRLEYEAWSTQAPAGMVRVSAAEFDEYVRKALAS
jgi:hypothetical protein